MACARACARAGPNPWSKPLIRTARAREQNLHSPFPADPVKQEFADRTGLTFIQVLSLSLPL